MAFLLAFILLSFQLITPIECGILDKSREYGGYFWRRQDATPGTPNLETIVITNTLQTVIVTTQITQILSEQTSIITIGFTEIPPNARLSTNSADVVTETAPTSDQVIPGPSIGSQAASSPPVAQASSDPPLGSQTGPAPTPDQASSAPSVSIQTDPAPTSSGTSPEPAVDSQADPASTSVQASSGSSVSTSQVEPAAIPIEASSSPSVSSQIDPAVTPAQASSDPISTPIQANSSPSVDSQTESASASDQAVPKPSIGINSAQGTSASRMALASDGGSLVGIAPSTTSPGGMQISEISTPQDSAVVDATTTLAPGALEPSLTGDDIPTYTMTTTPEGFSVEMVTNTEWTSNFVTKTTDANGVETEIPIIRCTLCGKGQIW
jgi:hypothetical protein